MHRPSTISHPTAEYEYELQWLEKRMQDIERRDRDWMDRGGIERMAKELGEQHE